MKTLFVGTSNSHKVKEIENIFRLNGIEVDIKTPKDFNDESDPVEDGLSFEEKLSSFSSICVS